jgi:hypothetical protein
MFPIVRHARKTQKQNAKLALAATDCKAINAFLVAMRIAKVATPT